MSNDPRTYKKIDTSRFLAPCEHRHVQPNLCMLASQKIGFLHSADPLTCAHCQIDGKPNEHHINKIALEALKNHLKLAWLDFHDTEETIIDLFKRAWRLALTTQDRLYIQKMLLACVSKNRVSAENAQALFEKDFGTPIDQVSLFRSAEEEAKKRAEKYKPPHVSAQSAPPPTQPCSGCGSKTQTPPEERAKKGILAQVVDSAKDVVHYLGVKVDGEEEKDQAVVNDRIVKCNMCTAVDSSGERLFRMVDDRPVCGKPRSEQIIRDTAVDGCGCKLDEKWRTKGESCPLEKW